MASEEQLGEAARHREQKVPRARRVLNLPFHWQQKEQDTAVAGG